MGTRFCYHLLEPTGIVSIDFTKNSCRMEDVFSCVISSSSSKVFSFGIVDLLFSPTLKKKSHRVLSQGWPLIWTMMTHPSSRELGIQQFMNDNSKMWKGTILHENQIFNIPLSTDNCPDFILQHGKVSFGIQGIIKMNGSTILSKVILHHTISLGPILYFFQR